MNAAHVEFLAKLSAELNTGVEWPEAMGRKPEPYTGELPAEQADAYRQVQKLVQREVDHHARIAAMRAIELAIGHKEVLRYWNTKSGYAPAMTNDEFEAWWGEQTKAGAK